MDREKRIGCIDRLRKGILVECGLVALAAALIVGRPDNVAEESFNNGTLSIQDDYIKWVDFTVSYEALCNAYQWDVKTHGTEHEVHWIDLLAFTAARTGGSFDKAALTTMEKAAVALAEGEETLETLTEDLSYFTYYREAYDAALGGLVGEYREEYVDDAGRVSYRDCYGLKGNREKYKDQIKRLQELVTKVMDSSVAIQAQEARNKKLVEDFFRKEREGIRAGRKSSKAAYDYYKSMNRSSVVLPQFLDSKK